jgi:hypothetical protein
MSMRVDDRTQVLLVSLKTEAELLKAWMARRTEVAQRRRDGPVQALKHRVTLLERELPRLEREVQVLERAVAAEGKPRPPTGHLVSGLIRGALIVFAALLWVVGVVTSTPLSRFDDPLRLAAMLGVVIVVALSRR